MSDYEYETIWQPEPEVLPRQRRGQPPPRYRNIGRIVQNVLRPTGVPPLRYHAAQHRRGDRLPNGQLEPPFYYWRRDRTTQPYIGQRLRTHHAGRGTRGYRMATPGEANFLSYRYRGQVIPVGHRTQLQWNGEPNITRRVFNFPGGRPPDPNRIEPPSYYTDPGTGRRYVRLYRGGPSVPLN